MLKKLSLRVRLMAAMAALSVLLLGSGVLGMLALSSTNEHLRTVYEENLQPVMQLVAMARLLDANRLALSEAAVLDRTAAQARVADVAANTGEVARQWRSFMGKRLTPAEAAVARQLDADRQTFVDEGLKAALAAILAGDTRLANEVVHGAMELAWTPVREGLGNLIRLQEDDARVQFEKAQATFRTMRVLTAASTLAGMLLALGGGLLLVRAITRPLEDAVRIAGTIAEGDLTARIEVSRHDEAGRLIAALQRMNDALREIVGDVRDTTEVIDAASREMAAGNQDLSQRTEEQASSLEETAASMEQLTSTVRQNADNARQASELAMSACDVATRGGVAVGQVVTTMSAITDASRRIADIIGVIDGIAFQTNILSLNAAVEAARAGEQGRGFAVVAGEVRNLAQRSAAAAREIKTLIEDAAAKVDDGAAQVASAGSTMDEVVTSIRRVAELMAEITAASQEQSAGIEQVNQAVAQMDRVTQQNAALVEQAAAAAQTMREHSQSLAEVVACFRLDGAEARARDGDDGSERSGRGMQDGEQQRDASRLHPMRESRTRGEVQAWGTGAAAGGRHAGQAAGGRHAGQAASGRSTGQLTETEAPVPTWPAVERRGPDRARNVTRMASRRGIAQPRPGAGRASDLPVGRPANARAANGADDDWTEF
jgi:methyl-accepting chemotaxis protein-1 (serine sensor receptor)